MFAVTVAMGISLMMLRPGWFRQWTRLEAEAVNLCTYECRLRSGSDPQHTDAPLRNASGAGRTVVYGSVYESGWEPHANRSGALPHRPEDRHALHVMRHRKDVDLSESRKRPGQTPFCGLLARVRAPRASNERHDD